MELYELGMALSAVLIAAVIDLLDASAELHRKPGVPALPCRPVGTGRVPVSGARCAQRGRRRRRPEPTTDAGAAHHLPPTCCSRAEADRWAARTRRTTRIRSRWLTTSNRTDRSVPHGLPDRLAMERENVERLRRRT